MGKRLGSIWILAICAASLLSYFRAELTGGGRAVSGRTLPHEGAASTPEGGRTQAQAVASRPLDEDEVARGEVDLRVVDELPAHAAAPVQPPGSPLEGGDSTPSSRLPGAGASPSIGNVRVLGHRGCDAGTPGWFLSAGRPDQYDFTVSEDGETLVVEPRVVPPEGNFEFVHCADPVALAGKRVRFSVRLKAEKVEGGVARLRYYGEDRSRERVVFSEKKATGTYDWTDFDLDIEVPDGLGLFSYGITFNSPGKLWINQPTFRELP